MIEVFGRTNSVNVQKVLWCLGELGVPFERYDAGGLYEMTAASGFETTSGIIGCVIAAIALYGGLALGLEDLQGKTVLPIGRRGAARRAFEGDLGEQVGPVESEAGVRKQL